jgi:hypothetical protein
MISLNHTARKQKHALKQIACHQLTMKVISCVVVALIVSIISPLSTSAMEATAEAAVPDDLLTGLAHLLALTGPQSESNFDPQQVEALMGFIASPNDGSKQYHTADRFDSPSAYIEFSFNKSLAETLRFIYNPDVPGYVLNPTSIRWSHWTEVEGTQHRLPRLWEKLDGLDHPFMVKGHEFVENTPDLFAHTYYAYGLFRTLILFKHNGNNVLISLSKQDDTSEVGKKGLIVGPDEDWNYLYSGKEGTGKSGLGWMRTYMYDSFSVIIYYEMPTEPASVKCGVFKWIRAGWLDLNVVKNRHIYKGLERFARSFKRVIESPDLPPPERFQQDFASIQALSTAELRTRTKYHLERKVNLIRQASSYQADKKLKPFYSETCLDSMSRPQMQSVLVLAYLKEVLGKP